MEFTKKKKSNVMNGVFIAVGVAGAILALTAVGLSIFLILKDRKRRISSHHATSSSRSSSLVHTVLPQVTFEPVQEPQSITRADPEPESYERRYKSTRFADPPITTKEAAVPTTEFHAIDDEEESTDGGFLPFGDDNNMASL